MITLKELVKADVSKISKKKLEQCEDLLKRVNIVRAKWGKAMIITSGVRTLEKHLQIYKNKGITDPSKIPMKSKHLETVEDAAAVDVSDPQLELTKWLKDNPQVLEECGLFCEEGNANWVHFQNKPFGSYKPGGTRWFKP